MVVLIVGLNLVGYAAFRLMGANAGTALAGVLGGVISSTVTTVSYARFPKREGWEGCDGGRVVAAGRDLMGEAGLFAAAAVSGLTDVDAITRSTARLVSTDRLSPDVGWRLVLIATLSNLVFKRVLAGTLRIREFARRLWGLGIVAIVPGAVFLVFRG